MTDPARTAALTAALVLAVASLTPTVVAAPVVALGAIVAAMRMLWLEQNIFEDLAGAARLPGGYEGAARRTASHDPDHLATAMRAEAQVWSTALLGSAASLFWLAGPGAVGVLGWAACFALAWRRADRLADTLAVLGAGRSLPSDALRRPVGAVIRLPEDDR